MLHSERISRFSPYLLAMLFGGLFPLAFAPLDWYLFAFFSPAMLFLLWQNVTIKQAFLRGWCYGIGLFAVGVSWVYVSIHVYGNVDVFLAGLFTLLFVLLLALFFGVQGMIFNWFLGPQRLSSPQLAAKAWLWPEFRVTSKGLILFPVIWLLMEWFRGWAFTGFPWLLIGYSQVNSPLKGLIPILGEFGTGFFVLLTSTVFTSICQELFTKKISKSLFLYTMLIVLVWITAFFVSTIHWTKPLGKPITASLIQGNIPQNEKWSTQFINSTLERYANLTSQYPQSNLIIWPEGAIPIPLPQSNSLVHDIDLLMKANKAAFLTGIPVQVPNSFSYYNALIGLGNAKGHYYKRFLVPFGEYIPFKRYLGNVFQILDIPMSDFITPAMKQPDLIANKIIIAPFICYEIAYAKAIQSLLPAGQLLVTVSDDAWFGDSFAPAQHLQIGQFRALESGRYLLFVGNNGITAIVNNYGQIIRKVPQFRPENLTGLVQPMIGITPWIKMGNWPIITILFFFLGILLFRRLKP